MSQQDKSAVELWYTRCGSATASALAIRQGWLQQEFAKPGTTLHSLRESESLATRNSHFNHSQSGMFREGGNIPPIWAKGSGQDTVVIGITWLDEYQGILSRADSGIRTVADLQGKRLGVPLHRGSLIDFQRGAAQHGYETALGLVGLTVADVTLVDIESKAQESVLREGGSRNTEISALERGEVDAIFIRYARGYRFSRDSRFHQVINIYDLPDPLLRVNNGTPRPITVDRAFYNKHPDVVVRYLVVLLETAEWARAHRDDVINLLRADGGAGDITAEEVIGCHGANVHQSFEPKLTPEYVAGLEKQKNFLHRWGYFTDNFDINSWIEYEPLQRAREILAQRRAERAA